MGDALTRALAALDAGDIQGARDAIEQARGEVEQLDELDPALERLLRPEHMRVELDVECYLGRDDAGAMGTPGAIWARCVAVFDDGHELADTAVNVLVDGVNYDEQSALAKAREVFAARERARAGGTP